jgi:putative DNA primase/helicase
MKQYSTNSSPSQQNNTGKPNGYATTPKTELTLLQAAIDYRLVGFSLLPVKSNKRPDLETWTVFQSVKPSENQIKNWFNGSQPKTTGLALIAGKVSGNLEVLDVDCKYDLTGTLMEDFSDLVKEHLPDLFTKLVIAKTVNNGFHILVSVPAECLEGSKKIASRPATAEEAKTGDKIKPLIETKGEGGYFVSFPTTGYEWKQGSVKDIPLITKEERDTLFTIARSFDQMSVKPTEEQKRQTTEPNQQSEDVSPFDDYNGRADIPALIESNGWRVAYQRGERIHYKRPGTTDSVTSANFHTGLKLFYVFSTSTEFEAGRGYNPVQVYTLLEHSGDYSKASKALYEAGYGSRRKAKEPKVGTADFTDEDTKDFFADAHLTDTGNAECFAAVFSEKYRHERTNGRWLRWDGTIWKSDADGSVDVDILNIVRKRQAVALNGDAQSADKLKALNYLIRCEDMRNRKNIKAAAELLRKFVTTIDDYDTNINLASTENGTLDLTDGSFRPAERSDYITHQFGTIYDRGAECPRWNQFLKEIFNDDDGLIRFMQKVVGYSLTGDISEQKLFIFYGFGKNGKTVFINTAQALIGDYAGTASFKTFDADKQSEQTNDLAMLKGKRFVSMIESAADKKLNEPLIKQITGGDKMTCRFLHKEFFEYFPQFKLFLATNHKPVITQSDFGIWRRIVLIPFTQNFEGREEDGLKEKLQAELSGILNWALEGLKLWRDEGLRDLPDAVTKATDKYKQDSDTIGQWLDLRTDQSPRFDVLSSIAYQSYRDWCNDNGFYALGNRSFKSSLEERGFTSRRRGNGIRWLGFELKPYSSN